MIELGQKVRFVPHWNKSTVDDRATIRAKTITGKVIYVNHQNSNFTVEYSCGGPAQRETFKFFDIGKEMHIVRGGENGC